MTVNRHSLAPYLQNFFSLHLRAHFNASQKTINSYREIFTLLFDFAERTLGVSPDKLYLQHLDSMFVSNFLMHLEVERQNSISTRNQRLSGIRSFFKYVMNREPDLIYQCQQILKIRNKRGSRELIYYLKEKEILELLKKIDQDTWYNKRDYLIICFMIETGVRVSELTGLKVYQVVFNHDPYVQINGKGRKKREIPLDYSTARKLESWVANNRLSQDDYLFTRRHKKYFKTELSRDTISDRIKKHAASVPSVKLEKLTPHSLRHSFAMRMLKAGNPLPIIALWLGHEDVKTTMIYMHADLEMKRQALELLEPIQHEDLEDKPENKTDQLRKFLQDF